MDRTSPQPVFVERRCSLPLRFLPSFEAPGLLEAVGAANTAAHAEVATRTAFCDALAATIAIHPDRKAMLVQVKRDVWNGRRRAALRKLAEVGPATAQIDALSEAWEQALEAIDASDARLDVLLRDRAREDRSVLGAILGGGLRDALGDGPATVFEAADRLPRAGAAPDKRARRRELTVAAYALRGLTKPTPRGRFSSHAVLGEPPRARRCDVLDVLLAVATDRMLGEALSHGCDRVELTLNPTVVLADGMSFISPVSQGEAARRIAPPSPLSVFASLIPGVATPLAELRRTLLADTEQAAASLLLGRAVTVGLLSVSPALRGGDAEDPERVLDWLAEHAPSHRHDGLRRLLAIARTWPTLSADRRQRVARRVPALAERVAGRPVTLPPDRLLVTTEEHSPQALPPGFGEATGSLCDAITRAPSLLVASARTVAAGPRRPALDVYIAWRQAGSPALAQRRASLRASLPAASVLDLAVLATLPARAERGDPGAWCAVLQPAGQTFVAQSLGVGFGTRIGRFLEGHEAACERLRAHNRASPGARLAALKGQASHQANRAPWLVDTEIALPGGRPRVPAAEVLLLRDLLVRGEGEGACLEHRTQGAVVPLFYGVERRPPSALLRMLRSFGPTDEDHPVARLVHAVRAEEAHPDNERDVHGVRLVRHRRLCWQSLTLGRAAVRIHDAARQLAPARTDRDEVRALGSLLERADLGSRVFVRDLGAADPIARRPFFVSLAAPLTLRLFAALARAADGPLLIEEALPDPLLALERGETHTREIQIDALPWGSR